MNYKRIYYEIINNRIKIPITNCYVERHHITPKSLGGNNVKSNIVHLTAREHFICHFLLAMMYKEGSVEWTKMNKAFMMMKMESAEQYRYFNSRLYESMRKNFSKIQSISQAGAGNSNYGTMWIFNTELRHSKKISKNEKIPVGWRKGRVMDFDLFELNELKKIELKHKKEFLKNQKEEKRQHEIQLKTERYQKLKKEERIKIELGFFKYAEVTFEKYINGDYKSIREFAKNNGKSAMHYSMVWKQYINNYNKLIIPKSPNNSSRQVKERKINWDA